MNLTYCRDINYDIPLFLNILSMYGQCAYGFPFETQLSLEAIFQAISAANTIFVVDFHPSSGF